MIAKLRATTIISIIIVILSISGCYLFFLVSKQQENLQLLIDSQKSQISTLLPFYAKQIDKEYRAKIQSFVTQRKNIIALFAARERDGLYKATLPVFTLLQEENSYFKHIDFILPDNSVFLSMHDTDPEFSPEPYTCISVGDFEVDVNVPTGGFIQGQCGLYYAVMAPVALDNKNIGTLIFAIRIGDFIEDIQENLGIHTALVLMNTNTDTGENVAQKISLDKHSLYTFDDPFFTSKAKEIKITSEQQRIQYDNSTMIVFPCYAIRDFKGDEIGFVLQALNLTTISKSYRGDLVRLVLMTLAVIIGASFILYWNFDKVLSELVKLNKSLNDKYEELRNSEKRLETEVAERTKELEKTNLQLHTEVEKRQDANLSLSRSIEEWQSTFDAITDPITILDRDLEVVIANKAAHQLLVRSEGVVIGKKCYELFVGSPTICTSCPVAEILNSGEQREYELDLTHYGGKTLFVTLAPIFDKEDFLGFVHIARDVTKEKLLKKQLAQAQKMEAIATLAGGIAHDFNNILGAILGNADLLLYRLASQKQVQDLSGRDDITYEDIESHLEAIKKAGNRAKDLVGQILAFSRQGKSQRQNADITPVIKEGIKLLRSSLPANIEIRTELDAEICQVYADLSQIHQVFMNLCTNAAQAMDNNGGILDVYIRHVDYDKVDHQRYPNLKPGSYIALCVKDTGHGMSPEVMERIFDPFFTTKDVSEGTGMGLAVIHGIITAHGGELDVQSEEGVGSEFTVFLPCVDTKRDTSEDAILGVPRGSEKILYVDDEKDILKMSSRMLEYLGYTVYSALSAEEAFTMLTKDSIDVDLIITDYSMPGNSGVQLAKDLLDAGKNIPVILCSGFSDTVILEQEARRGIRKFMSKPLDMKKLAVTIRQVLQSSNRRMNADTDN
ncbi:MAG: response regulator [Desulfobulbaceae bacterium]|nr:response regulator [Desulfobulbaceae bacterium]